MATKLYNRACMSIIGVQYVVYNFQSKFGTSIFFLFTCEGPLGVVSSHFLPAGEDSRL